MTILDYDLVAVGGGTAGLVATAGAAYLGLRAALVEREALGGDCLWHGCVPSKALIASARAAHLMRHADGLGLRGSPPGIAFRSVMDRMRSAREDVARHDDPDRFRSMGVGVHFGTARFVGPGELEIEGVGRVRGKRVLLATGASARVPPIPGLAEAGCLTHQTAFQQDTLPGSVVMLGGGPIGVEMAQVYQRLGARVTVVERLGEILPAENAQAAGELRRLLEEEGIRFVLGRTVVGARKAEGKKVLLLEDGLGVEGDEIFVAVGRVPTTESLEMERGGVEAEGTAVRVDATLRTTARGVWAAGDVAGGPQYTHAADHMARVALRNSLFPFPRKVDLTRVPRVTYTDPELAHVGRALDEAEAEGGRVFAYPFQDLDRAIVEGETEGSVRIAADRKGRILGATILGRGAGELLPLLALAMEHGIRLPALAESIVPYPTRAEGVKRAAQAFQRGRLEGAGGRVLRRVVRWLR